MQIIIMRSYYLMQQTQSPSHDDTKSIKSQKKKKKEKKRKKRKRKSEKLADRFCPRSTELNRGNIMGLIKGKYL